MNNDQLINKKFHILQRNKIFKDNDQFIYKELANRINLSLENINLNINNCLEIGFSNTKTYKYIRNRFNIDNYFKADISKEILKSLKPNNLNILLDNDNWEIGKQQFNLIISNFYLHLTNNFDLLLKNINQSLKKNGFFIATIPSMNCFSELKKSMILADEKIYGGSYQRFAQNITIDAISKIIKKYNFKIPVLEIDKILLKYSDFSSLINDIRYLGNSYIYKDRKKNFESKNYFKITEDIYWSKFSQKNKLLLSLEVIFITGWKEDVSQQKPLQPGEAKNSLKSALK